jgi:hypothetical protein
MPVNAEKFVPHLVVLAVAVYWLFPFVMGDSSQTAKKKAGESLEFSSAMLNPKFPESPKRDPFLPLNPLTAPETVAKSPGGLAGALKDGIAKAGELKGGYPSGNEKTGGKNIAIEKIPDFVLNGICIAGNQRTAVINGQVYQQKDKIGESKNAGAAFVVAEILSDKVLLEHKGKPIALHYLDPEKEKNKSQAKSPKNNREIQSEKAPAKSAELFSKSKTTKNDAKNQAKNDVKNEVKAE